MWFQRKKDKEDDLKRELRSDLETEIEVQIGHGLSPEEARMAALRAIGNTTLIAEDTREAWGWASIERLWQDARYATRVLRRSPGFALTAILTLALGIGANTAMFSVVNAVLLRALPYTQPDRLMTLWEYRNESKQTPILVSDPDYRDWKHASRAFEQIVAYGAMTFNPVGPEGAERVLAEEISGDLFPMLGVKPWLGRNILPEEDSPGHHVVLISYSYWQRRYNKETSILGTALVADGNSYTIIGVMPPSFNFPIQAEIVDAWLPLDTDSSAASETRRNRNTHDLYVIGRLRTGVSQAQAQAEMEGIADGLRREFPDSNANLHARLIPLREQVLGSVRLGLLILSGAVALVLLITCANVASILTARGLARQTEMALRGALGAGRARITTQLLVENILLALVGGAASLGLAFGGMRALQKYGPASLPRMGEASLDGPTLAFTACIALLTGVLFGLLPARQASKPDLVTSLRSGTRTGSTVLGRRARRLLVLAEVAMAAVLLVGAVLMIRSLEKLTKVNPGFTPYGVLTVGTNLPESRYVEPYQQSGFYEHVLDRISSSPGVVSAGAVFPIPYHHPIRFRFTIDGRPPVSSSERLVANFRTVAGAYFQTMEIPLIEGRAFSASDNSHAPAVAVINKKMAQLYWPDSSPIGKAVRIVDPLHPGDPFPRIIVGVVGDVKHEGLALDSGPEIYVPCMQTPLPWLTLVVRTNMEPTQLTSSVRQAVWSIDRTLAPSPIRTMSEIVSGSIAEPKFYSILLGFFASLAVLLSALGVYGVISYSVNQQLREIGIRMALGAGRSDVLRSVIGDGMRTALGGLAVGLIVASGLIHLMAGLLFGVQPLDPVTFAAVAAVVMLVALLASAIPAYRASRIDPLIVMR